MGETFLVFATKMWPLNDMRDNEFIKGKIEKSLEKFSCGLMNQTVFGKTIYFTGRPQKPQSRLQTQSGQ